MEKYLILFVIYFFEIVAADKRVFPENRREFPPSTRVLLPRYGSRWLSVDGRQTPSNLWKFVTTINKIHV